MTVAELIKALQEMPQDTKVIVFANDSEYMEASGVWIESDAEVFKGGGYITIEKAVRIC